MRGRVTERIELFREERILEGRERPRLGEGTSYSVRPVRSVAFRRRSSAVAVVDSDLVWDGDGSRRLPIGTGAGAEKRNIRSAWVVKSKELDAFERLKG